jgi:tetratricopeptide (TPR) repeat protein
METQTSSGERVPKQPMISFLRDTTRFTKKRLEDPANSRVQLPSFGVVVLLVLWYCLYRFAGFSEILSMVVSWTLLFVYVNVAFSFIARDHRKSLKLIKDKKFDAAIDASQASYDFFSRNTWLDRFRAVVFASRIENSFRETALCNIASCHAFLGNAEKSLSFYRQAIEEFPASQRAASYLQLHESMLSLQRGNQ